MFDDDDYNPALRCSLPGPNVAVMLVLAGAGVSWSQLHYGGGGDTAEGTGLNSQALAPSCSIVSPSRDHKYTHNFQSESHSQRHAAALKDKSIELLSEQAIFFTFDSVQLPSLLY